MPVISKKSNDQQELIAKTIPGISQDEIAAHFNLLPERYFVHTDSAEIACTSRWSTGSSSRSPPPTRRLAQAGH
jgi:hypothetical protein